MNDYMLNKMVEMSDGNPGAATALSKVYSEYGDIVTASLIINLESKGIKGWRIWYAYKYCFLYNVKDMVEWFAK